MIWFAMIVPVIAVAGMYFFFKKNIAWWEYIIPIALTAFFILIVKSIGEFSLTKDTEYWGGVAIRGTYYEEWNERVSCRHIKYKTVTRTSTDSKGNVTTYTEQVFDGYEHAYDVDYHGPRWEAVDSNGFELDISQSRWLSMVEKFQNKSFQEMNRDYHTIDGDAYVTTWDQTYEKVIPITTTHMYENRIQHSDSVFNYKPLKDSEKKGLYEYVDEGYFDTPSVLPTSYISPDIEKLNALLGAEHEVRVWVLIYQNAEREIAQRQEAYWKNGNMNELVICIGVDNDYSIQWADVFSWTKNEEIKVNTRNFIESQIKLDFKSLSEFLFNEIPKNWKRRDFSEFSYLRVEQPTWAVVTAYIIAVLSSIGCMVFSVKNEYNMEK